MRQKFEITDTSDPDQVKKAQDLADDEEEDLHSILLSARGRRWLNKLLFETCHIMRISYAPVPGVEGNADFNDGARSVGLAVWGDIEARHPEFLKKLVEERHG